MPDKECTNGNSVRESCTHTLKKKRTLIRRGRSKLAKTIIHSLWRLMGDLTTDGETFIQQNLQNLG